MKQVLETPLFAVERKQSILQLLNERLKITVPELCDIFHVSSVTIRNDLRDLEAEGRLKRTHGGAILPVKASFEATSAAKSTEHIAEKRRIARFAASLVDDGDTIILDAGTTTLELAKCLSERRLTIVTNDLQIASWLETNSLNEIIVIGGHLRRSLHCTVGAIAASALQGLNVDKAFMATNAFSLETGFTTPSVDQAEVKRSLIRISSEVIMLMDSSKIGRVSFARFADLSGIDRMVCDCTNNTHLFAKMKEIGETVDFYEV